MLTETFSHNEYETRLSRVQLRLVEQGISHLFVTDPANIYYLTGYDAYSFYVPQALLVPSRGEMSFFCREVDAPSAWLTTVLEERQVFGYPERYVQQPDIHPMDWVATKIRPMLEVGDVLAVESESPHLAPRAHRALVAGLGEKIETTLAQGVVNWARAIKSPAEIALMHEAGRIVNRVFSVAAEVVRPGVRECDAVAEIYAAGIQGVPAVGGTYPAIPPLVLVGAKTAFPHVGWSDTPIARGDTVALELAGCRLRYHVPLTRTMCLGEPPQRVLELAEVTNEGLETALGVIRAGATCQDVAAAWGDVIASRGLTKPGRVGYPVGIGFPPDWGEQTMSFRIGDKTTLETGMTFHVMIGMWQDGWGYSISETVLVTDSGAERLADVPRDLLRR